MFRCELLKLGTIKPGCWLFKAMFVFKTILTPFKCEKQQRKLSKVETELFVNLSQLTKSENGSLTSFVPASFTNCLEPRQQR